MSKAKEKIETRDVFNRKPRSFHMLGKEFKYEFIPSGQFQGVLLDLLAAVLTMDKITAEAVKKIQEAATAEDFAEKEKEAKQQAESETEAEIMAIAGRLLNERIYDILSVVLQDQNDYEYVSPERLMKKTSALEMAKFSRFVMEDEEILDAFQEYVAGLGKLSRIIPKIKGMAVR